MSLRRLCARLTRWDARKILIDNDLLKAEQIIAHHNRALNGFSSGKYTVNVKPASEITFPILYTVRKKFCGRFNRPYAI
jgi:hypothetical protein